MVALVRYIHTLSKFGPDIKHAIHAFGYMSLQESGILYTLLEAGGSQVMA